MPTHWAETYVGRAYDKINYNCGDLVVDIQKDQFDRIVDIPVERREYDWKELTAIISEETPKQAALVSDPIEGDVVLISNGPRLKHVGVYIDYDGTPCVVHNMSKAGVCIHPVSGFGKGMLAAMKIDSYYRVQ